MMVPQAPCSVSIPSKTTAQAKGRRAVRSCQFFSLVFYPSAWIWASTKGLPFGARKKPPLVMRYKVGAHFLPQFAISARSNICQRETHSCLFSQGFFSSPEENQPTCHYNAHRQTAPPAGWRYLMWLSTLAICFLTLGICSWFRYFAPACEGVVSVPCNSTSCYYQSRGTEKKALASRRV